MSKKFFLLLFLSTLIIFACNLPAGQSPENNPDIVFTAAAQTASAQLTEVALGIFKTETPLPSAPTPIPSFTPPSVPTTEGDCDKAKFIADITVPDGTIFPPNKSFTKTWRIKNIGTCPWTTSYTLVFDSGEKMGGVSPKLLISDVAPGETVDMSVNLVAPATDGKYIGNWQIRNASNTSFAKIYVQIRVGSGDFAVTSVNNMDAFSISGRGISLSAKITTSKKGKVKYHWILKEAGYADIETAVEEINFGSAETNEVSTLWKGCPHTGNFKAYIYIDDPNHQEFGQVGFNCP